jgi:LacI family transcriptional regulator
MVTIKDVSKKSGFSVTTVSKALNDYPDISQKTKDKILKLCDDMGYVPNLSARSLVNKKSYTIGVIFEEITGLGLQHPLFSKILESFKNEVEKSGYDIMFLSNSMGGNNGSYYQHCLRKQVDAVLVVCAEFDSAEMHELYDGDIPTVVIDFMYEDILNITSNNHLGVKQAVRYLKELGHEKIAHIHGSLQTYIGGIRHDYFKELMAKYDLPINEAFIVNGEYFSKEDGYNAMQKLLALKELPTAVFCASDMLAIGAIQAIQQANLSVPEDISIIGFDGIDIGQIFSPRLTTIRQDSRKMGKIAASNILTMISENNFKKNNTIMVDTYLITGETTRVLR